MAECRTVFVIVMSAFPSLPSVFLVGCVYALGGGLNNGKKSKERTIPF